MLCGRGRSNGELRSEEVRDKSSWRRFRTAASENQSVRGKPGLRRFNSLMRYKANRAGIWRAVQVTMQGRPDHRRDHKRQEHDRNNDAPACLFIGLSYGSLQISYPLVNPVYSIVDSALYRNRTG